MNLSDQQLKQFDEEGYLFFPGMFSEAESRLLKSEADAVYAMEREEVWREKSGVARTAFAAHTYNEGFRRLGAHPRLIDPVSQVLEGDLYMHQFKVNAKAAFDGDVWQWHQDYGTWKRDDEMPEPRAMNIAYSLMMLPRQMARYYLSRAATSRGLSRQVMISAQPAILYGRWIMSW